MITFTQCLTVHKIVFSRLTGTTIDKGQKELDEERQQDCLQYTIYAVYGEFSYLFNSSGNVIS